eukprot:scaffold181327_cov32-Tisochrysis_lutea.AAC.2
MRWSISRSVSRTQAPVRTNIIVLRQYKRQYKLILFRLVTPSPRRLADSSSPVPRSVPPSCTAVCGGSPLPYCPCYFRFALARLPREASVGASRWKASRVAREL